MDQQSIARLDAERLERINHLLSGNFVHNLKGRQVGRTLKSAYIVQGSIFDVLIPNKAPDTEFLLKAHPRKHAPTGFVAVQHLDFYRVDALLA